MRHNNNFSKKNMKFEKLFLTFFTLISVSFSCFSQEIQDTLYLKNGQVITGKIIGRYPDKSLKIKSEQGETFYFPASEIFNEKNIQSVDTVPVINSANNYYQEKYEHLRDSLQRAQEQNALKTKIIPQTAQEIMMSKAEFYKIRDKNMLKFMSEYDNDIAHSFRAGMSIRNSGRGLTSIGATLSVFGLGFAFISGLESGSNVQSSNTMFGIAICASILGDALITIGLPFNIVSGVKRNKAKDAFYNKYFSSQRKSVNSYTPTLQLKVVPNGVGLALNF